jgi:hypothetical protein
MGEIVMGTCTNCDAVSQMVGGTETCPYCGIGTLISGFPSDRTSEKGERERSGGRREKMKTMRITPQDAALLKEALEQRHRDERDP